MQHHQVMTKRSATPRPRPIRAHLTSVDMHLAFYSFFYSTLLLYPLLAEVATLFFAYILKATSISRLYQTTRTTRSTNRRQLELKDGLQQTRKSTSKSNP